MPSLSGGDIASPNNRPLRIGYVAENSEDYLARGWTQEQVTEFDTREDLNGIVRCIQSLGHSVDVIGNLENLTKRIVENSANWDLVWNMSEGNSLHEGREAQVPGLLEAYALPFMFSDAATMALCLNKAKTKMILHYHGVPTAPFAIIPRHGLWSAKESIAKSPHRTALSYPFFVKPACEDSSKGIYNFNKVNDEEQLETTLTRLRHKFPGQDILVENYLDGREFTVLIGGSREYARIVGVMEFVWIRNIAEGKRTMPEPSAIWIKKNGKVIHEPPSVMEGGGQEGVELFDFELKNVWDWRGAQPVLLVKCDLLDPQVERVADVASRAYRALDCFDCARVDIRHDTWDSNAVPNLLEINPIPGMTPGNSCFSYIAAMNGLSHTELIQEVIEVAVRRLQI